MSCKQLLIQFSINFVRVRFHGKILVNIIGWLLCSCYGKHTFLYLYLRRPLLLEIYRVAKSFRQRIYFIKKKKLKNVHPCNEFSFFLKKSSFFCITVPFTHCEFLRGDYSLSVPSLIKGRFKRDAPQDSSEKGLRAAQARPPRRKIS